MILRRSGIEKILNFYGNNQAFMPYDIDNFLAEDIRRFTVLDDVVAHLKDALSNIAPGSDGP
jgi:hypothetical protein